jgi:succinate dehydrogenase / fumarate reductase flavoprotein subunit
MFNYIPEFFKAETADNIEEAERWYADKKNNRRTPDLLPRDEVARAINSEVKAGRGIAARRRLPRHLHAAPADYIRKRLPSHVSPVQGAGERRHHQGADGSRPDLPLRDGRRARRGRLHRRPRCRALRGRRGARRHARLQPSRRQLAVRPAGVRPAAGQHAALYAKNFGGQVGRLGQSSRSSRESLEPFDRTGGENPYAIQADLQETMQTWSASSARGRAEGSAQAIEV